MAVTNGTATITVRNAALTPDHERIALAGARVVETDELVAVVPKGVTSCPVVVTVVGQRSTS
jgi:hypothetical protein